MVIFLTVFRWYNIPVDSVSSKEVNEVRSDSGPQLGAHLNATDVENTEADSQPLDFETFIPAHDPSLATGALPAPNYVPENMQGHMVSQDEAFSRAVNAMYWAGYWTAIYKVSHPFHG